MRSIQQTDILNHTAAFASQWGYEHRSFPALAPMVTSASVRIISAPVPVPLSNRA